MGSLADSTRPLRDGMDLDGGAAKSHLHNHEGSCSSSIGTPEPDGEAVPQDSSQRQKRKGGRKPIYATSEERKQRNRQAQAAFRERRTEYIKQLESTIKHNEEALQTLQQSHRSAADECLMLRYKNSLLERVLLEKGIDVQAELRLKSGSPGALPAKSTPQSNNPSPLSRPPMTQSFQRPSGLAPKLDAVRGNHAHPYGAPSPQLQPTPSSHVASPSAVKSPGYPLMSPTTDIHAQQQHPQPQEQQQQHHQNVGPYQRSQMPPPHQTNVAPGSNALTPSSPADAMEPNGPSRSVASHGPPNQQPRVPTGYCLSLFQKHYVQLDQEYDAQAEAVDEQPDGSSEPNTYPAYRSHSQPQGRQQGADQSSVPAMSVEAGGAGTSNTFIEHFDPMLDADPFGLTASMHFQTPFSYAQSQSRT